MAIPLSHDLYGDRIISRERLSGGASGAIIERIGLDDGRILVRKAFSPASDWMMRATRDRGRAAELWVTGAMDRLPRTIDPAIVAIESGDEGGWVLWLEDVSDSFVRAGTTISTAEVRRLLAAAAEMHAAFDGIAVPGLAAIEDLLLLASPTTVAREAGGDAPFLAHVEAGWEAFDELVPSDVRDGVRAALDDPHPLAEALRSGSTTLVHADLHYGNVAPTADRFYVLDWGLATHAPAALDVAWYLDQSARFLAPSRDEVLGLFAKLEGPRHDPRILRLALLAELVLSGWSYRDALDAPDEADRQRRRADLQWWIDRARTGLIELG